MGYAIVIQEMDGITKYRNGGSRKKIFFMAGTEKTLFKVTKSPLTLEL